MAEPLVGIRAIEGSIEAATVDSVRVIVERVTSAAGSSSVPDGTTVTLALEPNMIIDRLSTDRGRTAAVTTLVLVPVLLIILVVVMAPGAEGSGY